MKKKLNCMRYFTICLTLVVNFNLLAATPIMILDQKEIEEISAHPNELYAYLDSTMMQDLPTIKNSTKHTLIVDNLDFVCNRIAQGKKTAPVKIIESALQEAAYCVADRSTTLSAEELCTLATRLEQYYKQFEAGNFDLVAEVRRVNDRSSKTFRNIDVINSINGRYLSIARNAVIVGDLTIGDNTTIDKNLTVLGSQTIAGNLNVTGTINGSSGGSNIVNGGQTGPLKIGTTNATSLTFVTNGASNSRLTIDAQGGVTIATPAGGETGLTITGGGLTSSGTTTLSSLGAGMVSTDSSGVVAAHATNNHAIQVGNAAGTLTSLAAGTDGQLLIGSTGADPVFNSLTSTGGTITYTPGAGTLSLDATAATTTQAGVVALATNAETIAGTVTDKAVTPDDLKAKLGTQTDHGVLVGAGTSSALTALTVGTDGQLLIGSTGADPVFNSLTSTGGTITYTPGAGTLNLDGTAATTTQAGVVALATNAETIAGTVTDKAVTPDDLKAKLGTQTDHGVLVGAGTSSALTALTVGATGTVLIGNDNADPSFSGSPSFSGTVTFADGSAAAPSISFAGSSTTGFYQPAADEIAISIAGNNQVTVDSSGGVTIASPTSDVPTLTLSPVLTGSQSALTIELNTSTSSAVYITGSTASSTFPLVEIEDDASSQTSAMFIAKNGGQGHVLDARGGPSASAINILAGTGQSALATNSNGASAISVTATGDTSTGDFGLQISGGQGIRCLPTFSKNNLAGGALPVLVDSTGAFGIATSSGRFKENLRSLDAHSAKIYDLNPVLFDYKAEYGASKNQFGLIAEEVDTCLPGLVIRNAEGEIYTVAYHQLIPLLLNEIKHHQTMLEKQSQLIEELLSRIPGQ